MGEGEYGEGRGGGGEGEGRAGGLGVEEGGADSSAFSGVFLQGLEEEGDEDVAR